MKALLFLALGGALGAICRWGLATWIDRLRGNTTPFPLGIFTVNLLGCVVFGAALGVCESRQWFSEPVRLGIFSGFLGSFTTFSTFSWLSIELIRQGNGGIALLNLGLSVILGMVGAFLGYHAALAALGRT